MDWKVNIFLNGKWIETDIKGSYKNCGEELRDLKKRGWLPVGTPIVMYWEQGIWFVTSENLDEIK